MKKQISLAILLFLIATCTYAQFSLSYYLGFATYSMGKMGESFNNGLTHQFEFAHKTNSHQLGLKFTYLTAKGKLTGEDFSVDYNEKTRLNGYKYELFYRYYFINIQEVKNKFNFFAELSPGLVNTVLSPEVDAFVEGSPHTHGKEDYSGLSFSLTPMVGGNYHFTSWIAARLAAGYEFNFPKSNLDSGHATLSNETNWSGFRLNVGVCFTFDL